MDCQRFFELLKSRRSIRQFTDRKPSRTQIECLIEAASWAPSNHNRQGWKFIVFEDRQQISMLAEQTRKSLHKTMKEAHRLTAGRVDELFHFAGAFDQSPIVILAMHKKSPAVGRSLLAAATSELASGEALSTAMAVQNLLLAAHAIGLGTCVMTAPLLAGEVWKSLRDFPAGFEPTCLITVGYPASVPAAPRRKKLEHILEYR
jgi:nitroreductase